MDFNEYYYELEKKHQDMQSKGQRGDFDSHLVDEDEYDDEDDEDGDDDDEEDDEEDDDDDEDDNDFKNIGGDSSYR